ncbi:MAG TPA: hypothetical protein VHX39_23190 [Acetobacteraceae bacterium]|jgi:hypothetical protein|nr:hypothetical protein [Acetobacteraceae bacterium]
MINGLDDEVFLQALRVLSWSNVATAILVHPKTGSVRLEEGPVPKEAYGEALNATLIRVSKPLLGDPVRLAIVIVHELTHCLDFDFAGDALRSGGRGWASEINAHMNQGMIMRELNVCLPKSNGARANFDAMARSNTTFGNCMEWKTRSEVAKAIMPAYRDLARRNDTTHTTDDSKWQKDGWLHYFPVKVDAY